MTLLVALAAMLAPALPVSMVSVRELGKLRDWWLRGVLLLGSLWLLTIEPWLGLMGLWYGWRWRSPGEHPGLVTWVAIGATWGLLRTIPASHFEWIVTGWLVLMALMVARCAWIAWFLPSPYARRAVFGLWRTKANQGSPAITAMFFALVFPFTPWWLMPVLLIGVYLTWSWNAMLGISVALGVLYPAWAGIVAITGTLVLGGWFLSWRFKRFRVFEWVPRGDSFDSVINRLILWWLIVQAWWNGPRIFGRGPYSLEPELRRWSARCWIELPNGEACCDPLQHLYEYGLVGILAVGALAVRVLFQSGLGDPWTAALAAAAAMAWGHYPCRQPAIGLVVLTVAAGVLR